MQIGLTIMLVSTYVNVQFMEVISTISRES